jgi:hypothetical protein
LKAKGTMLFVSRATGISSILPGAYLIKD